MTREEACNSKRCRWTPEYGFLCLRFGLTQFEAIQSENYSAMLDKIRSRIDVPGLIYRPDFISVREEMNLIRLIDESPWSNELRRRVQQYGWKYDYKQRFVDQSARVSPLPVWAMALALQLRNAGLMCDLADQVIVNEYRGKQGISRHRDQTENFNERVATISLLETWGMIFRNFKDGSQIEKTLTRRSVAVLTGDARYKWTHEIPSRNYERINHQGSDGMRIKRVRRISITFRILRTQHRRNRVKPFSR